MKKQIWLKLGTLGVIATPMMAVISCGGGSNEKINDSQQQSHQPEGNALQDLYQLKDYLNNKLDHFPQTKKDIMASEEKVSATSFMTKLFNISATDQDWINKSKDVIFSDFKLKPDDRFGDLTFSFNMHKGSKIIPSGKMKLNNIFLNSEEKQKQEDMNFLDSLGTKTTIWDKDGYDRKEGIPYYVKEQNFIFLKTSNISTQFHWEQNIPWFFGIGKGNYGWIWENPNDWPGNIQAFKGPWHFPEDKDKFHNLLRNYADIQDALPMDFDKKWQINKINTNNESKNIDSSTTTDRDIYNLKTKTTEHGCVFLAIQAQKGQVTKTIYIAIIGWADPSHPSNPQS